MEQCSNGNVFICTQSLIQELIKVTINDNVKQVCFANDSSEDGQLKGMKKRWDLLQKKSFISQNLQNLSQFWKTEMKQFMNPQGN